jgi:hypothetical protein
MACSATLNGIPSLSESDPLESDPRHVNHDPEDARAEEGDEREEVDVGMGARVSRRRRFAAVAIGEDAITQGPRNHI